MAEGTNPSRQRNRAVAQARGEVVYFLDDDALVTPDCLRRLEQHFHDPAVTVVGGPSLTPVTDSLLQRAFGAALGLPLGSGGVCARYRQDGDIRDTTERELILCNLAIRREHFLGCGGLNERLYPNEENELLDRLQQSGARLLYDPHLTVQRSQRPNLGAFVKQMFRYGAGRARQTRLAGMTGLMPFAPLAFVVYLAALPFAARMELYLPLLVYGAVCLISGILGAWRERNLLLMVLLPGIFPLMHCANGCGLAAGFLLPLPVEACYTGNDIVVRTVPLSSNASGAA